MALLAPADQDQLRQAFSEMTTSVRLLFFTQTIDCETCLMTRQILDELPPLSDRIAIEELNFVLDRDKAAQYAIDRVPAIAVVGENGGGATTDSRIRFLGAPSGHEFVSLVRAIRLVGGAGSSLTEDNRRRIAAVDTPVTMRVFTTPT
jgi:alkyl hydroperoxide reductase subunit AhpF